MSPLPSLPTGDLSCPTPLSWMTGSSSVPLRHAAVTSGGLDDVVAPIGVPASAGSSERLPTPYPYPYPYHEDSMVNLDDFAGGYLCQAVFMDTDLPTDTYYDGIQEVSWIHPDTLAQILADCAAFQAAHMDAIMDVAYTPVGEPCQVSPQEMAGNIYFLTRNAIDSDDPLWGSGHSDWNPTAEHTLYLAARAAGPYRLYRGPDGLYHGTTNSPVTPP